MKRDDLVQQTRAADAAQAAATLAYEGNRLTLAGVIVGFLTLAAAAFAAWWAREAARETRAGARAAEKALAFMAETNAADLRPYLFIDRVTFTLGDNGILQVAIWFRNYGKIPARSIEAATVVYPTDDLSQLRSMRGQKYVPIPVCAPGHERRVFSGCYLSGEDKESIDARIAAVVIRVKYRYYGRTIKRFTEDADYLLDSKSFSENIAFLLTDSSRENRQWTFEFERDMQRRLADEEFDFGDADEKGEGE